MYELLRRVEFHSNFKITLHINYELNHNTINIPWLYFKQEREIVMISKIDG